MLITTSQGLQTLKVSLLLKATFTAFLFLVSFGIFPETQYRYSLLPVEGQWISYSQSSMPPAVKAKLAQIPNILEQLMAVGQQSNHHHHHHRT